jgi:hypothetical protein
MLHITCLATLHRWGYPCSATLHKGIPICENHANILSSIILLINNALAGFSFRMVAGFSLDKNIFKQSHEWDLRHTYFLERLEA